MIYIAKNVKYVQWLRLLSHLGHEETPIYYLYTRDIHDDFSSIFIGFHEHERLENEQLT